MSLNCNPGFATAGAVQASTLIQWLKSTEELPLNFVELWKVNQTRFSLNDFYVHFFEYPHAFPVSMEILGSVAIRVYALIDVKKQTCKMQLVCQVP